MSTIEPRPLNPYTDAEPLIELFDLVFGATVTPAMWAWKYLPPWASRHYCWVGTVDDEVVGYMGAVPLRGWLKGAEVPFFQFADFMAHPDHRLKYDYFEIAPKVVMADLGEAHPEHLLYGFSSHRAFLWFKKIGLSGLLERARTRCVPVGSDRSSGRFTFAAWEWDAPEIDAIWTERRGLIDAGLIRDTTYLGWRYGNHPINGYRVLGVLDGDAPIGWVVMSTDRAGKKGRPPEVPIVDLLIPDEEVQAVAGDLANHLDQPVMLWLPSRIAPGFPSERDSKTHVYHFVKDSIVDTEFLQDHLYYTMGDVDWW